MLLRVIQNALDSLVSRSLVPVLLERAPAPKLTVQLEDLWDGILNAACPKRKITKRKVLMKRYGDSNWKYGQKLFQPKRDIVTCPDCGNFHELHAICRDCYKKIAEESKAIIASIRNKWGSGIIDKEVNLLYQGEIAGSEQKRIVELDRPRPLWFAPNLSQKTANPDKTIDGPPVTAENRIISEKG